MAQTPVLVISIVTSGSSILCSIWAVCLQLVGQAKSSNQCASVTGQQQMAWKKTKRHPRSNCVLAENQR
ncbi:hypothetical protein ACSS6W_002961 [Trichoderma asperelloides]